MTLVLRGGPCDGQKLISFNGLHFITDKKSRVMIQPWQELEESPELMGDICTGMML